MTDLQKFVELYKSFGIECKVIDKDNLKHIILSEGSYISEEEQHTTSVMFDGYCGFHTKITFLVDGGFIGQEFLE